MVGRWELVRRAADGCRAARESVADAVRCVSGVQGRLAKLSAGMAGLRDALLQVCHV